MYRDDPRESANFGRRDMDYTSGKYILTNGQSISRMESYSSSAVPEEMLDFLKVLKRAVRDQNVGEIHSLYEYGFFEVTDKYYRSRNLPDEDVVRKLLNCDLDSQCDEIFIALYKDLYYHFLYDRFHHELTIEQRCASYMNFMTLFDMLLKSVEPLKLNLPDIWLWEMIDEFIYQFQSFCHFKCNQNKITAKDLEELQAYQTPIWNFYDVVGVLYSMARKPRVEKQLYALKNQQEYQPICAEIEYHPMYFKFGYFSLIGLLRLHTLLGEYSQALTIGRNIEFHALGLYNAVPSCMVSLHYYSGFCHMMMRQYKDAIKLFVDCLLYIQRTRSLTNQTAWRYDVATKTAEQIYELLAICLALQPQRIDESIQAELTKAMGEKMTRMQRGYQSLPLSSAFIVGCPKFLVPTLNRTEAGPSSFKEPLLRECRIFLEEVKQQKAITILRGYMKLYSTMDMAKLSSFMEKDKENLVSALLSFKHKMSDQTRTLTAEEDIPNDIDFYIDMDMIHIADTKVAQRYGEYFIRHVQKLIQLNQNLPKLSSRSFKARYVEMRDNRK
ncbi:Eukaryotic translation initiation factor 3 subunit L [Trichinella patagoniensis]|uniref:Eukaryotic translation initiation factor 3 subunit L n=1 Tax=Trichinella patagoniensis TaxID=990121 RepID=A0A0V1A0S5_9BILA|nr:Eukaryotic translation initiation factor 3 subunit L [Trichinella patagoniensis]